MKHRAENGGGETGVMAAAAAGESISVGEEAAINQLIGVKVMA
jgi:hypothetical protein